MQFWINAGQCQGAHLAGDNCLLSFKKDISDIACLFDFTLLEYLKEQGKPLSASTLTFGHTLRTDSGLFLIPVLYGDGSQQKLRVTVIELEDDELDELLSRAFPRGE